MASSQIKESKILIYGMNYWPEPIGVGKYTGELASYLAKTGVRVEVITSIPHYPGWMPRDNYKNWYSRSEEDGTRVWRCPIALRSAMRGLWRAFAPVSFALASFPIVAWRILAWRPTAILCIEPTLLCAPVAVLLAKLTGARTLLHVQDLEFDAAFAVGHLRGSMAKAIAAKIERLILARFDRVVTISKRMREKLLEKGVRDQSLALVRNWVDTKKVYPIERPSAYRARLGIPEKQFVALYAGNIGAKQGLDVLLEAASALNRDDVGVTFVVAGDGPEKQGLMSRYGSLGNVVFLPIQPADQLCELLNLADAHVLPQDRNAADLVLPSKLGGMLASGKMCLVMADPGTELHDFLDGVAVLIPSGNSRALADAIERLSQGENRGMAEGSHEKLLELDYHANLSKFRALLIEDRTASEPWYDPQVVSD